MINLGSVIGSVIDGNPGIVVVPSEDVKHGVPMEVTGIKLAKSKTDGTPVIVLTI